MFNVKNSTRIDILCGYGGIGRRAGLRILSARVQVRPLSAAPLLNGLNLCVRAIFYCRRCLTLVSIQFLCYNYNVVRQLPWIYKRNFKEKSMSNKERFLKRKRNVKIAWAIASLLFLIITVLLIILSSENADGMYRFLTVLFGIADFICLTFFFCSLAGVKFHTYKYKEYEISLYLGWSCGFLLLNDEIVDKHTGSWWGASPILKVGSFTFNNYTLCVGNKILH